jgi:hypothetical protein
MTRRVILYWSLCSVLLAVVSVLYTHWRRDQAMTAGSVLPNPGNQDSATTDRPISQEMIDAASKPATSVLHQALKDSPLAPVLSESSPGRFQVYRQGDLTWRLDTQTGETCVLLATNAEWRKPQIYKNGCKSAGQ